MAIITGTGGNDTLTGTAGNDEISGLDGNDTVVGGAGNDSITGNNGVDWVEGGLGNDTVRGGSGRDSLVFREAGSANADLLQDYASNYDNIQLDAAFFASIGSSGRFAPADARFHAAAGANRGHDGDDRIVFNTSTGQLWYDADGNGSGAAQLIATLPAGRTVIASDFWAFRTPPGSGQTINGTSGSDSLVGGPGNDTINGLAGNDTLVGLGGDDRLIGGPGNDSMDGGLGNDTYVTESIADEFGNGNDTMTDAGGIDTIIVEGNGGWLRSGSGIENLTVRGYGALGQVGATGNELNNVIRDEGPGNTFIDGLGGNDTLIGNDGFQFFTFNGNYTSGVGYDEDYGHDVVDGGGGFDWLLFENNSAAITVDFRAGTVSGGSTVPGSVRFINVGSVQGTLFDDVMFASDSGDGLHGYGGNDTLIGGAGADGISGDSGFGHPTVDPGNDRISGGGGNDEISGEEGDDWIDGGAGNDNLFGGENADSFVFTVAPGAPNADTINDFVSADDQIVLDGAVHANSGSSGTFAAGDARFWSSGTGTAHDANDRVIYNTSNGQLWYDADGNGGGARQLIATLLGAPTLTATDIEVVNGSGGGGGGSVINGTSGNDTLTGTFGNDTINGLGGNDLVLAGSSGGADVINGGAGFDSIELASRATRAMVVDFAAGTITGGSSGTISFTGVERVVAGSFNDSLTGSGAVQNLGGNAGADTLWGAGGNDTLWGGGGADTFIFRETGSANADSVRDWASGTDKAALDNSPMSALGAMGNFAAGDARFWSSSTGTAHDANDRVIYNTSTGSLYYDADGNGAGAAQLIATFQGNPAIAATDVVVI